MARARYQEGSLGVRGKGPKAKYFVVYRVYDADGVPHQKKETIGLVKDMSKREALKRKAEVVAERTAQLPNIPHATRGGTSFEDFMKKRFLPLRSHWSEPNRDGFDYIMNSFVLPAFGSTPIDAIDKVMIQAKLNAIAKDGYSASTVRHVRGRMSEVFEEAIEQEFIIRNPATKSKIPREARKPHRPTVTAEQLIKLILKITDARDKALFMTGVFCALRTSEALGLPWRNFHYDEETSEAYYMIDQIAWRGEILQQVKTEASEARVHIGPVTLKAVLQWRKECSDTSPDMPMFQSTNKNGRAKKGKPMWPGSWLSKRIQPLAESEEVGIKVKVNFRLLRRTASTLAQEFGASLASAQGMLRHESPDTTARVYTRTIPENVKTAVNNYESMVYAARG